MSAPLQFPLQVRFRDVDAYGHVNNATYFTYLEDARSQLIHTSLGSAAGGGATAEQTFEQLVGEENFVLAARHEIEYSAPLLYRPHPVHVEIWVTRIGSSSFDFGYRVAEDDGSTVYAVASSSMVLVSRATGKPVPLSEAQRHALETWLGGDVPYRPRRDTAPAQG
ncbi:acyl-CoA thioesterase [Paenarthrobacter sp. DKR-5]|uniref:acyl-CoA thioesterase n=1 Tax=Paenarthrobacter sp. DKR-5 TaxID=2835535 RepID=UPI001BDD805E|nr:thioesterase family protein [Paenarthrobacter sp. DKR-5]MBT1003806.1 acyl-CoA thioesterase [Paenarthrobacter sp. DKR-5]